MFSKFPSPLAGRVAERSKAGWGRIPTLNFSAATPPDSRLAALATLPVKGRDEVCRFSAKTK
jgi:hypothetical protein